MQHKKMSRNQQGVARQAAPAPGKVLPLAALMLAGSLGTAQQAMAQSEEKSLSTVTVKDTKEGPTIAKESLLVKQTGIAKGNQDIRDIPQTVTVMTEHYMDDRNYDDLREVLKSVSGVTFQAGETGEEDVRIRGFSLQQAGDIYVDGLHDNAMVQHDTYNLDRVEVLKGSASMLFGKGSTGGVVNQVNKQPFLMDQSEVNATVGNGRSARVSADINRQTGESSAFRVNIMKQHADNWGATVDKQGIAPTYRWGIGERDEYSVGLYHLRTDGRPNYNHPWLINNGKTTSSANTSGTIVPVLDATAYYGLASDYLRTESDYGTVSHKRRLDGDAEIKTTLRYGHYSRDLLASNISWGSATTLSSLSGSTVLNRRFKARRNDSNLMQVQSEYTGNANWGGLKHSLVAGVDYYDQRATQNNNATSGLPSAPTTTVGTPDNGAYVQDTRAVVMAGFRARSMGFYGQDVMSLTEQIKLVGGLRYDRFMGKYGDTSGNSFSMDNNLWSPRLGAIWQPNDTSSYYASYGTSYNTSGDTYQYGTVNLSLSGTSATLLNTPPEKSRNFELGAKYDVFDKKGLFGVALFRSEKYNERNTDVDTVANQYLLSGKRHATGMEFNFAGRLTPAWEVFYNHTWIPSATIDVSSVASTSAAQRQGDRPALTPKHSATLWSTYRVLPGWRVGGGLNYRGAQNPDQNRNVVAEAFTTVDAMVEHNLSSNTLLRLNVSNLTNKLYADQLYRGFYVPGAPRRIELTVKALF